MDSPPKTRRESKKSSKEKKNACYSGKHIRTQEALAEKRATHNPPRST